MQNIILGINDDKKEKLLSFLKNISEIENLLVVMTEHLIKNPGIIERIETEVLKNNYRVVFVGVDWKSCLRVIGESSLYSNGRRVEEAKIYWVTNTFSISTIRNK